jgi:hypothetical protein
VVCAIRSYELWAVSCEPGGMKPNRDVGRQSRVVERNPGVMRRAGRNACSTLACPCTSLAKVAQAFLPECFLRMAEECWTKPESDEMSRQGCLLYVSVSMHIVG